MAPVLQSWGLCQIRGGFISDQSRMVETRYEAAGTARDPAASLGSNLCGAALGGFLEYLSLICGVRSLTLVAAALYGLSALALGRSGPGTAAASAAPRQA